MSQQVKVSRALEFRRRSSYTDGTIQVLEDGRIDQIFGANLTGIEQGINQQSATKNYRIGTRRQIGNRIFYYARANSAQYLFPAYGAYNINTMSETGTIVAAVAENANQVTLTAVGTVTADQFENGWLVVESGTYGYFPYYQIKSNTAGASTYTVTIYDKFVHSMATSDETVTCMKSEFNGVDSIRAYVVENSDWPAWEDYVNPVCVPPAVDSNDLTVTKSYYFWGQTWGPCQLMGVEDHGASAGQRTMWWYRDGSVSCTEEAGFTNQRAGYLLPNAYYSSAGHNTSLCMLTISP